MRPSSLPLLHEGRPQGRWAAAQQGGRWGCSGRGLPTVFRRKNMTTEWRAINGEGSAGGAAGRYSKHARVLEPVSPSDERPCTPGPQHWSTSQQCLFLLCPRGSPSRSLTLRLHRCPDGRENWQQCSLFSSHSSHWPRFSSRLCLLRKSRHFKGINFESCLTSWISQVLKLYVPTFRTWTSFPSPHSSQNRGSSRHSTALLLSTDASLQVIYK